MNRSAAERTQYPTELVSGGMRLRSLRRRDRGGERQERRVLRAVSERRSECENRFLFRRTLAERIILAALGRNLPPPRTWRTSSDESKKKSQRPPPETIRLKEAELQGEGAAGRQFR